MQKACAPLEGSLMSIKKLENGRYEVDIRPTGRNGKRIRRKFQKKHEAIAFERYVLANHKSQEWQPKLKDKRHLSELAELWWKYKGKNDKHADLRQRELKRAIKFMGDPVSFQINKSMLTYYCHERFSSGIKAATINRELWQLSGMFTFLIKAGLFQSENPMKSFKRLKVDTPEMSYLSEDEIAQLLLKLVGDNYLIAIFCLSTGARWSEALKLKVEHIVHNRVTFFQTKNGKPRTVPISSEIKQLIIHEKSSYLFPDASYLEFCKILKEIKPSLPKGQATHVMRHTFATHFMINGGNIITLQRILGHSNIEQTMTYAHFAPDYLEDAIKFNPLNEGVKL